MELKGALNDPVARRFLIVRLVVVVLAGFTIPFPESDIDPDFLLTVLVKQPSFGT